MPRRNGNGKTAGRKTGTNTRRRGTNLHEFLESNPTPTSKARIEAEREASPQAKDNNEPQGG